MSLFYLLELPQSPEQGPCLWQCALEPEGEHTLWSTSSIHVVTLPLWLSPSSVGTSYMLQSWVAFPL